MTAAALSCEERLAACALVRGRFAGRAELEREARRDPVALARLEARLAMPGAEERLGAALEAQTERRLAATPGEQASLILLSSGAERRRYAVRLYARGEITQQVAAIAAPDEVAAIDALRARRRDAAPPSSPAAPAAYRAHRVRQARAAIATAISAGVIRRAAHSHDDSVAIVVEGAEAAASTAGMTFSSAAGLSAAYCRKAYRVATSEHRWAVSLDHRVAVVDGRLYLSPTRRVRAGRGTALVVEHLRAGSGGRLVWS